MTATVLIDNLAAAPLVGEWGLSVFIEQNGRKILLDTGTTGAFAENADRLGIDLAAVDFGVLSHAHYDHSDGMAAFFDRNRTAPFWIRREAAENCYSRSGSAFGLKYIGVRKGTLTDYADRIRRADGDTEIEIAPGVHLLPHRTNLAAAGRRAGMYRRRGLFFRPDDFSHEQTLVIETEAGLAVLNSCCHGGADRILTEVAEAFPGRKIAVLIGGFHLFRSSEEEVLAFARRVKESGAERIYTGHCTGDAAFALLKRELGERIGQFSSGFRIEI